MTALAYAEVNAAAGWGAATSGTRRAIAASAATSRATRGDPSRQVDRGAWAMGESGRDDTATGDMGTSACETSRRARIGRPNGETGRELGARSSRVSTAKTAGDIPDMGCRP